MSLVVRDAEAGDLPAVLAIHNHVVASSDAIFTEELDTLAGRREWFEARGRAGLPVLVAVREGAIAGYASYGPFRPWPGYRDTVEHSVHVASDQRRGGVGRALLEALIERAREAGMHVMVAGIDATNEPSLALHGVLGFERCGYMAEVARKQDRLLDLVLMQLTL
ncbi:MAG TPA: GNAT family N-acetyltransferase [Solirubrobacteraceae bacterium]|jgi:phosphinothricin acetyltransferase